MNHERRRALRRRDDRGASMLEFVAVTVVGSVIFLAFANSSAAEELHDGVREAVCEVRGPGCGTENWTEHDRPEMPQEPDFSTNAAVWMGAEVTGSGDAAIAVEFMLAQVGKPYQWGGNGPNAWDCSGVTHAAWREAGVYVPRHTVTAWNSNMPRVSRDELQAGDLIYWHTISHHPSPSHMGMYLGDGMAVHCGNPCKISPVDSMPWVGANRPPQG